MVRKARETSPTKYYHLMMRGNNREAIFRRYEQKHYFTGLLKDLFYMEKPLELAAYCIMNNHVHILAYGEIEDLSHAFKKINIQYAMVYNSKMKRIGHVFQDRFRSEIIRDDTYFLQLIRYIHNNPVAAKIVEKPDSYSWSSYREFITKRPVLVSPNQMEFIISLFNNNLEHFIEFHFSSDFNEYLDTKEDIERNRKSAVMEILSEIMDYYGTKDISSLLSSKELKKEAVRRLLKKTSLSQRNIASLLNISSSMVRRISRE